MCVPVLRFQEFHDEWEISEFEEHLDILSGYGFKAYEYVQEGIPLIKIDNVSYGKIIWDNVSYLPESYLKSILIWYSPQMIYF